MLLPASVLFPLVGGSVVGGSVVGGSVVVSSPEHMNT